MHGQANIAKQAQDGVKQAPARGDLSMQFQVARKQKERAIPPLNTEVSGASAQDGAGPAILYLQGQAIHCRDRCGSLFIKLPLSRCGTCPPPRVAVDDRTSSRVGHGCLKPASRYSTSFYTFVVGELKSCGIGLCEAIPLSALRAVFCPRQNCFEHTYVAGSRSLSSWEA